MCTIYTRLYTCLMSITRFALRLPDMLWTDNARMELYTDSAGGKGRDFGIYY
jgi:hypothetical protein